MSQGAAVPISSSQGAYQNDNGLDAAQHGAMQLAQLSQQPGMMGGVGLPMMQVNMGTGRLVAAMEHLDRIVGAFADDMGRSVAQIRSEINAEREMAMLEVAQTQSAVDAPVAGTWTGDVATPLPPTTASKSRLLPESSSSPRMPKLRLNTSQQAIGANGLPSPGARGAVTLPSAISPRSPASRRPAFLLSNGEPQPMRSPRLRREISYLNESKGHGILARSPADLDFVLPPSAVPETNAVYARSPLPPSSEAAPSAHSSDEGDDITPKPLLWQNRVFPNRLPASRHDCVLLSHWLAQQSETLIGAHEAIEAISLKTKMVPPPESLHTRREVTPEEYQHDAERLGAQSVRLTSAAETAIRACRDAQTLYGRAAGEIIREVRNVKESLNFNSRSAVTILNEAP